MGVFFKVAQLSIQDEALIIFRIVVVFTKVMELFIVS